MPEDELPLLRTPCTCNPLIKECLACRTWRLKHPMSRTPPPRSPKTQAQLTARRNELLSQLAALKQATVEAQTKHERAMLSPQRTKIRRQLHMLCVYEKIHKE